MESKPTSTQDMDDAEETLSLCDLPIYGDQSADWENFSKEDQSSSSFSDQENYFEFFSEEWSSATSTTFNPAENIIFCGKLIPYKEAPVSSIDTEKLESKKQKKPRKRGFFRWNLKSFNKRKSTPKSNDSKSSEAAKLRYVSSPKSLSSSVSEKYRYRSARKCDEKHGFSVQRVSILASPTKSRWYLFAFGLARFPTEMDLSDMKNRQSRHGPSTLFRSDGGDKKVAGGRSRGKGLWGLISSLACSGGSHHANAVVKASFVPIPRE